MKSNLLANRQVWRTFCLLPFRPALFPWHLKPRKVFPARVFLVYPLQYSQKSLNTQPPSPSPHSVYGIKRLPKFVTKFSSERVLFKKARRKFCSLVA